MASRKSLLRQLLRALAKRFVAQGWELVFDDVSFLELRKSSSSGALCAVQCSEPVSRRMLPSESVVGLACVLEVSYPDIERRLSLLLGEPPEARPFGFRFDLGRFLPPQEGVPPYVMVLPLTEGDIETTAQFVLEAFSCHFAPLAEKLNEISVLAEADYLPDSRMFWTWNTRRLLYLIGSEQNARCQALMSELKAEAIEQLAAAKSFWTSQGASCQLAAFAQQSTERTVREVLRLISVLEAKAGNSGEYSNAFS